ncbi:MAG TPA: diguanylate cyclase, partial [Luteimonas sp.]|nr:diguanylate cyclase [Luteimonas sp.]
MAADTAGDGTRLLDALLDASHDPALPGSTHALLLAAHAALLATRAEADAAHIRYRSLFDAVPDPVSIIAIDGTVLDVNRAGLAAYARTRGELVGQPIHVINPDLPRDHMGPVREAMDRGDSYLIEVTNMRGDGTRFPVEVHSAAFSDDGRPCVVAVARDLSRRHDAEIRYCELMEVMDQGIVLQDAAGAFVHGNSAALRMLGIAPGATLAEQMRYEHWMAVREDGREMPWDEFPAMRALRSGRLVESTVLGLYHRERRSLGWLSVTAVPQFAAGAARPHQVLSLFSDVTRLKRDSALFDRVQAIAHIGGWDWDCLGDRLYLTDESAHILGQQRTPRSIAQMAACLAAGDGMRLRAAVDGAVAHGRGFELDLQGLRGDGRTVWMRVIGEPEPGDAGTSRVTGTVQDISGLKRNEESLRVQARTDPLTGLLNRDAVLADLERRLTDPHAATPAVLYVDLDRFKMVNDVLGHAAGDLLLVEAATRIRVAVGGAGAVARFGGDEFLVVCDIADDAGRPERLADAILATLGDGFRFGADEFAITASIGIARAPDDGLRPQQLIQNADIAMYDSKHRARNAWQAFTPELARRQ